MKYTDKKHTTISFKVSKDFVEKMENLCKIHGIVKSKLIRILVETEFEKMKKIQSRIKSSTEIVDKAIKNK